MYHVELLLLVTSLLFFAGIFTDKLSTKFGIPALLLFLAVGMLFGNDGLGLQFDNVSAAQLIGSMSLCVILFAGGLGTKFVDIRPVIWPGVLLATEGVAFTWLFSGLAIWAVFHFYGSFSIITLPFALLMAATMSSTDASAVFSILGNKGVRLRHNLRPLLELESGSNDPMAYLITITMMDIVLQGHQPSVFAVCASVVWSLLFGLVVGFGFARLMVAIMNRMSLNNGSLYPIMILTACIFIYSASSFLGGNSYLAVYIGGLVLGNSKFPHKRSTMGFIDGLSWLCQLLMFLVLGLLVQPHDLPRVAVPALIISAILILLARPLAVWLTLLPFPAFRGADRTYVSWVGLKGAVPIILAIQCAARGVPNADILFNIAFVCTIVSLLTQGTTLTALARRLGLTLPRIDRHQPTHFDIDLPEEIADRAMEMLVTEEMAPADTPLCRLGLGQHTLAVMLRRGDNYLFPNGQTLVQPGDYLLLLSDPQQAVLPTNDNNDWEHNLLQRTRQFLQHLRHKN